MVIGHVHPQSLRDWQPCLENGCQTGISETIKLLGEISND
jgi:hypothetical protein